MSYKILSVEPKEETLSVTVEYNLGGVIKEMAVPIFMPLTKADIILGVENREVSEQRKMDAVARNLLLKAEVEKNDIGKLVVTAIEV